MIKHNNMDDYLGKQCYIGSSDNPVTESHDIDNGFDPDDEEDPVANERSSHMLGLDINALFPSQHQLDKKKVRHEFFSNGLVNGKDGHWVTTEDDHKLFISHSGKILAGNPHVIAHIQKHHPEGKAELTERNEKGQYKHGGGKPVVPEGEKDNLVTTKEQHGRGAAEQHERGGSTSDSGHVEGETEQADDADDDQIGASDGGSTDHETAKRVPAPVEKVNRNIDRFIKTISGTLNPQHPKHNPANVEAVNWLHALKEHVNRVGVHTALDSISDRAQQDSEHQHTLEGDEEGRVGYITLQSFLTGSSKEEKAKRADGVRFITNYLDRHGIDINSGVGAYTKAPTGETKPAVNSSKDIDINKPAAAAIPGKDVFRGVGPNDSFALSPIAANKLKESRMLPGLESTMPLNKVTKFTPKLTEALDKKFGKDKWLIKRYDEAGVAGQGIYPPARIRDLQQTAQKQMWQAGSELGKYGFSIDRDKKGEAIGVKHDASGDRYPFGSEEYDSVINGDVRKWGDVAKKVATHENGVTLQGAEAGDYMAQPAFPVVGLSEEARAKAFGLGREGLDVFNKVAKQTREARTHVDTLGGKAYHIPSSTWVKGEHHPVVFESPETKSIRKAAVDAVNQLPEEARAGQTYGPDVIRTVKPGADPHEAAKAAAEGRFDPNLHEHKVIELNPVSQSSTSGYLLKNPMVIDSYVSHMMGRDPQHVKYIKKLLTEKEKEAGGKREFARPAVEEEKRDKSGKWTSGGGEGGSSGKSSNRSAVNITKEDFYKEIRKRNESDHPHSITINPGGSGGEEDDKTAKQFSDTFRMKPATFINAVTKNLGLDESHTKITTAEDGRLKIDIHGEINGGDVFITRYVDKDKGIIDNDHMELPKEAQGKGTAKQILSNFKSLMQRSGIKKMKTHANLDVGGYTWLKYGYLPTTDKHAQALHDQVKNRWDNDHTVNHWVDDGITKVPVEAHSKAASEEDKKNMEDFFNSDPVKDPTAFHRLSDTAIGKKLLLRSNWYGTLDFGNKYQRDRYNAYANRSK